MTPTATLKPNREDLNKLWSEWRQHVFDRGFDGEAQQRFALLLEYERAVIDRESQARAIRWSLSQGCEYARDTMRLANQVERGEIEVT
jgi:hypothetical protein